ncbi:Dihydrofolate reductase [Streptosporangium canum]|uniref:Dihydrofolate reductase n=1 Tax=Streptosporangium canum TaxID=324952 RepID=A0A1I3G0E5_9ACTN|nr:dihydrofolate reductase family protein [Streptosporangium canum]SFI16621.1 Dihydrofolate reductase [Streptosporangium canum]
MRKIIASTFSTLDGFIDEPHTWSMEHNNDEWAAYSSGQLSEAGALLMGRVTFEGMAQTWPAMPSNPFVDKINSMPKYTVSSTIDKSDWANSTVIPAADLVPAITKLKEEPGGDIIVWGCGRLTDALLEAGLMDEYRIWVYPVVRGHGQRFWSEGLSAKLSLTEARTFGQVVLLDYRTT